MDKAIKFNENKIKTFGFMCFTYAAHISNVNYIV